MPKRAVIYARYSNEAQNSATIDTQVAQCRAKLDALKYEVVGIFKDEGISASDTQSHKRTGFAAMLADAEQERFDALCVFDLSRFSRQDPLVVLQTKERLDKLGVEIILVDDTLPAYGEDDDPDSRLWHQLLWLIKAGQNSAYIHKLSRRVRLGCRDAIAAGYWVGAPPYGYCLEEVTDPKGNKRKRLAVHPEESIVVRRIFEQWCQNASQSQITESLNADGIHPRKGGRWVQPRIADILTRPTYIGRVEWHAGGKHPETVTATCPAIIDEETWHRAQTRIDRSRKDMGARALSVSDRPLAGLVWCGDCGKRFVTCKVGGKGDLSRHGLRCASIGYRYTVKEVSPCDNHSYVDEATLVRLAKDRLLKVFREQGSSRDAYERARQAYGAAGRDIQAEIAVIQGQMASKEGILQRIYAAFERDPDLPYPRERVVALREEVERLATRIASLQAEQQRTPTLPEFSAFLEWYGERVREIQNLDGKAIRAALQDLGVRITVLRGGEVRIVSRLPVPYQDIRNPATLAHPAMNPTGKSSAPIPPSNPANTDHTRLSTIPHIG